MYLLIHEPFTNLLICLCTKYLEFLSCWERPFVPRFYLKLLMNYLERCLTYLFVRSRCHNQIPQTSLNNRDIFSHISGAWKPKSMEAPKPPKNAENLATSRVGSWWSLSSWLTGSHLYIVFLHGLSSSHLQRNRELWYLFPFLWEHECYWIRNTPFWTPLSQITSLKVLSPSTVTLEVRARAYTFLGWRWKGTVHCITSPCL